MNVWLNGRIVPPRRALVSALDPAVQIGSGLFEVMRAYAGVPFLLDRHLVRMRKSARQFGYRIPYGDAVIAKGVLATLKSNRLREAYVRLVVTEGGSFMIIAKPLPPIPKSWYVKGAAVDFAPWRRDPRAPLTGHKTLNYLENVLTLARAKRRGLADLLFLSTDGHVLEGCVTNVFLVKDGRLQTPLLEGILPGVTRGMVSDLAEVVERPLTPGDFQRADEAFLTNALVEVLPIAKLGTKRFSGVGNRTRELMEAYKARAIADGESIPGTRRGRSAWR